jgi:hypothetical protein
VIGARDGRFAGDPRYRSVCIRLLAVDPSPGTGRRGDRPRADRARGVIEYRIDDPGVPQAEQRYRLLCTIEDPEQAPASELAGLYSERWELEGTLDELKTHQRGPRAVLRSKQPEGVYQEAYGYLCTHYAIRRLMHDAALQADLDPDRLSFTRSLRAARRSTRSHPGFSPPEPRGRSRAGDQRDHR